MSLIQQLLTEHRIIENVLDIFENKIAEAQATKKVDVKFFTKFLRFVKEYVESYHHIREERCLFTVLADKNRLFDRGLLEVIQHEHRLGRQKTSEIQKTFFQYSTNQACLDDVLNSCIEYVEMLRQHIYKEDRLLFPLSDRIMDKEDQERAFECSKRIEELASFSIHRHVARLVDRP
jgi:hemerythrin-like domain-containing protein